MTVKQAIEKLQQLPQDAQIGSFNPMFVETIYLVKFRWDTKGLIQVEFADEPICKD